MSVRDGDKRATVEVSRDLEALGYGIAATRGTANALEAARVRCRTVNKVREGRPHIVDMLKNGEIDMIVNTTEGRQAIADSYAIRRTALQYRVPYFTTIAGGTGAGRGDPGPGGAGRARDAGDPCGGGAVNRRPLTKHGAQKLRDELRELKTGARPEIINAIAEARAHGDLRENAEYHAAKEQQSFIEGRIAEIEGWLGSAEIIDPGAVDAAAGWSSARRSSCCISPPTQRCVTRSSAT